MRTLSLILAVCLVLLQGLTAQEGVPVAAAADPPPELVTLKEAFERARFTGKATAEKRQEDLKASYLTGVDSLQKQATQKGDLDAAVAARSEAERVRQNHEPTMEQRKALSGELAAWRGRFETGIRTVAEEGAKAEAALRVKYLQDLEALQIDLTKRSKLEQAVMVKKEKDGQLAAAIPTAPSASAGGSPISPAKTPPSATPASSMGGGSAKFFGVTIDRAPAAGSPNVATPQRPTADPVLLKTMEEKLVGAWKVDGINMVLFFEPGGVMHSDRNAIKGCWQPTGRAAPSTKSRR